MSDAVTASAAPGNLDDEYIPRPQLSVPPVAQSPILLPMMGDTAPTGRFVGVLALYIDETGRVQRIQPLEPRLPPEMEQAALATFQQTPFTPGQVNGIIVKSRIKVEVIFENLPNAAPVPFQ